MKLDIGEGERGRGGVHGVENWKNDLNPKPQKKLSTEMSEEEWDWSIIKIGEMGNVESEGGRTVEKSKLGEGRIREMEAPTTLPSLTIIYSKFVSC